MSSSNTIETSSSVNSQEKKFNNQEILNIQNSVQSSENINKLDNEINSLFSDDKNKFIGEFQNENYKIIRGYLEGQGECLRLYYTKFLPLTNKIASLCLVHGFGEYSGRFLHIAAAFAKQGFVVHMIDLRGFGYSGGPRSCSSVKQMHRDIEVLLKQASPNLPLFIYGHSMGGALVLSLLMQNPDLKVAGVIATAPELGFPQNNQIPWAKRVMIKLIGKQLQDVVANALLNPTSLTKNNYEIRKIINDRLMIPFLGMNMARNLIKLTEYTLPNAKKFAFPIILLHGAQDQVISYKHSVEFYQNCSSVTKKLKIFEWGYHELQHDNELEQLKKECLQFCQECMPNSKPLGVISKLNIGIQCKTMAFIKKYIRSLPKWKSVLFIIISLLYITMIKMLKHNPKFSTIFKRIAFPLVFITNYLKK